MSPHTRTTPVRSARTTPRSTRTCSRRSPRCPTLARAERLGRDRARLRQDQPAHHGDARRRQHRHLRASCADERPLGHRAGQGHPRLRSRPARPRGAARADGGHRHRRLHARRDAARARLSRAQEARALLRPLRHRVAEPAQGVRRVPRRDPDDDELPHAAA